MNISQKQPMPSNDLMGEGGTGKLRATLPPRKHFLWKITIANQNYVHLHMG